MSDSVKDTISFLNSIKAKGKKEDDFVKWVFYHLTKEFGMSFNDIMTSPIPYILGLLSCYKLEVEEQKKAMRKK